MSTVLTLCFLLSIATILTFLTFLSTPIGPSFRSCLTFDNQNPDTPAEKPKLQSYKVDMSQCGPMMLDALVSGCSLWIVVGRRGNVDGDGDGDGEWRTRNVFGEICRVYEQLLIPDQNQERARPDAYFPKILPRRYLRILRHEH